MEHGKERGPRMGRPVEEFPPHPGPLGIELRESTALFSLSSDGGGGEGRGEERFYWISPLPNPLPARSSQGEGDRRSTFQCLIQWPYTPSLSPRSPESFRGRRGRNGCRGRIARPQSRACPAPRHRCRTRPAATLGARTAEKGSRSKAMACRLER
jgi:hypothetical protein